ncbi:hypothetical protein FOZ62_003263, partial [Perkinsus olseni]
MMDQHREEAEALDLVIEHRQRAFVEAWDRFMLGCEARAFAMLNRIQQRHITEMEEFEAQSYPGSTRGLRKSTELRDLEKKYHTLGKLGCYQEACSLKGRIQSLTARDGARSAKEATRQDHHVVFRKPVDRAGKEQDQSVLQLKETDEITGMPLKHACSPVSAGSLLSYMTRHDDSSSVKQLFKDLVPSPTLLLTYPMFMANARLLVYKDPQLLALRKAEKIRMPLVLHKMKDIKYVYG